MNAWTNRTKKSLCCLEFKRRPVPQALLKNPTPLFFHFFLSPPPFLSSSFVIIPSLFYYNNKNTNTTIRTIHPYLPTFGFNGKLLVMPQCVKRGGDTTHSSPPAPSCLIRKHGERRTTLLPFLLFHFHLAIDHP